MLITSDQARDFKEAVSVAAWKLDLWRFAEVIGSDSSHIYTQDKFKQLSVLSKALAQFDAETLAKIVNAAKGDNHHEQE
jgi:hypothetical protein